MSQSPEQRDLTDAIARMRAAVLAASFRKLRYRLSPDEITTMLAERKSDAQAFDHIESRQSFFTKLMIRWRRFRRGRNR